MPGEFGTPYRAPWTVLSGTLQNAAWPDQNVWYLGGPRQHYRDSESALPVHANTTKVPNYHPPATPSTIPPYPRPATGAENPSTGDCPGVPLIGGVPRSNPPATGEAPYGPWEESGDYAKPSGGTDHNTYEAAGTTVNLATCWKYGFKNVQAAKVHHGVRGFLS